MTVFIACYVCGKHVVERNLPEGKVLPPSEVVTWHERMVGHLKREHVKSPSKRSKKPTEEQ